MTQEEAVMKRLTAEELAGLEKLSAEVDRLHGHFVDGGCKSMGTAQQLSYAEDDLGKVMVDKRAVLLAMASRLVELESHDAPLDVPFGCDPGDSAALEKLRMAIDDNLIWPSDEAREAGDYEAAVRHSGELALRWVSMNEPAPVAEAHECSTCGGSGTIDEPGAQSGPTSPCPDCVARRPRAPVAEAPERVTIHWQPTPEIGLALATVRSGVRALRLEAPELVCDDVTRRVESALKLLLEECDAQYQERGREIRSANTRQEQSEREVAGLRKELERVNKHRAAEQRALRRRLHNQKTALRQLHSVLSGERKLAAGHTEQRRKVNVLLGIQEHVVNPDHIGAIESIVTRHREVIDQMHALRTQLTDANLKAEGLRSDNEELTAKLGEAERRSEALEHDLLDIAESTRGDWTSRTQEGGRAMLRVSALMDASSTEPAGSGGGQG